jgi:hypothetical protein
MHLLCAHGTADAAYRRECNSSLFFRCRYEYHGRWHPKWLPERRLQGYELKDLRKPKAVDVQVVHNAEGEAKRYSFRSCYMFAYTCQQLSVCGCRWLTGLKPAGYMDQQALKMFAAPVMATKFWSRMAISKPHSNAVVVLDNFPKEAFWVAVVMPFLPRKPKPGKCLMCLVWRWLACDLQGMCRVLVWQAVLARACRPKRVLRAPRRHLCSGRLPRYVFMLPVMSQSGCILTQAS